MTSSTAPVISDALSDSNHTIASGLPSGGFGPNSRTVGLPRLGVNRRVDHPRPPASSGSSSSQRPDHPVGELLADLARGEFAARDVPPVQPVRRAENPQRRQLRSEERPVGKEG